MTPASLVWGTPDWWWPAAALAAAALAVLVWGYFRAPATLGVRGVAGVLKAMGIAALALCLLEPLLSGTRPRPGANLFVLLADDSRSLEIRDPVARKTRSEILGEHFTGEAPWHTRLSQDFDVRSYRFAERLELLDDEAELTAAGDRSSLATALKTIARRFRGRPLAGILVFTDGNATDLPDESTDWSDLPPIYPVPLGTDTPVKDVRVAQVAVSQTNFELAPVTIRAKIEADGYEGEKLAVQLLSASGEVVEQQTLAAGEEDGPRVVRFRLRPRRSGVSFYEVRAAAASELGQFDAPGTSVEATLANNSRRVTVERPAGPFRVLYVSGRPNWEFKFLRRALEADREVELVGLVRIAKREPKFTFLGRLGESSNPLFKGFGNEEDEDVEQYDQPVLVRIGTRDEAELRDGFPKAADELYAYDALILDDLEAGFFTPDQMLLLNHFVSRRGGGLLMLGGAESFRQGDYPHTPVAELLPVYLDRQPPAPQNARYRLALTREGWLQPWIRLRETEHDERGRLESMPAFHTINRLRGIKPGATVLANVTDGEGKLHPALVAQRFGKGRAAALVIGDLWRWELRRKPDDQNDLAKAWRQTVRWLVADVPGRIEMEVRRPQADFGNPVELRIDVRDPEHQPMDNASVDLTVTKPDGNEIDLRAEPGTDRAGSYMATYVPRQPGDYLAKVVVSGADGSEVGEKETGWTAQPAAEEFRRLAPDLALLQRMAEESGGDVVPVDRLGPFVADLPNRKVPVADPWIYPLWHQPLVFLLAIACLAAEWGLRRFKGLP
ncbi:MAG: glutamine amidotransferase [Planctomycetota bacterium]